MGEPPPIDPRLLEMLDCCRPSGNDRRDAAFADLEAELSRNGPLSEAAQRIAAWDTKLGPALAEVALPAGLYERILERLSAQAPCDDTTEGWGVVARLPELQGLKSAPVQRPRRYWLAGAAVLIAAGLAAIVVSLVQRPAWPESEILDQAVARFTGEEAVQGRQDAPPAEYPFSRSVLPLRGTQWRYVEGLLGRGGVAYDLPAGNGSRATLYVLRARGKDLPAFAPARPSFDTGDCTAAAWQEGELLYVLAVRGDARAYRAHLDLRSGPMAFTVFPQPRAAS